MGVIRFQTDLADGLFVGTAIPPDHTGNDRFLLENDGEILIAYDDEVTVIEVDEYGEETIESEFARTGWTIPNTPQEDALESRLQEQ